MALTVAVARSTHKLYGINQNVVETDRRPIPSVVDSMVTVIMTQQKKMTLAFYAGTTNKMELFMRLTVDEREFAKYVSIQGPNDHRPFTPDTTQATMITYMIGVISDARDQCHVPKNRCAVVYYVSYHPDGRPLNDSKTVGYTQFRAPMVAAALGMASCSQAFDDELNPMIPNRLVPLKDLDIVPHLTQISGKVLNMVYRGLVLLEYDPPARPEGCLSLGHFKIRHQANLLFTRARTQVAGNNCALFYMKSEIMIIFSARYSFERERLVVNGVTLVHIPFDGATVIEYPDKYLSVDRGQRILGIWVSAMSWFLSTQDTYSAVFVFADKPKTNSELLVRNSSICMIKGAAVLCGITRLFDAYRSYSTGAGRNQLDLGSLAANREVKDKWLVHITEAVDAFNQKAEMLNTLARDPEQ